MSNIKSINNKITYRQVGDYLIPNLILSAEAEEMEIGVWGMRRKNYLMHNNHVLFCIMLADGTLWNHLVGIDKQAEDMFSRLVDKMAKTEGVTEELKAEDQMAWVGAMNNIVNQARESVYAGIIYA